MSSEGRPDAGTDLSGERADCMTCGETHPVEVLDILPEDHPEGPRRICAHCDAKVNAHMDLWEVISQLERVDWGVVPDVTAAEAATFQKRLREADDKLTAGTEAAHE